MKIFSPPKGKGAAGADDDVAVAEDVNGRIRTIMTQTVSLQDKFMLTYHTLNRLVDP